MSLRYGVMMGVDHLFSFGRNLVCANELAQTEKIRVLGMNIAAGDIEIAANGHETDQCPGRIEGVDGLFDGVSPLNGGWMKCRIIDGGGPDFFGWDTRYVSHFFRGKGLDMRGQFIKSVRPFGNKILVMSLLVDDHIQKRKRQCSVCSGFDLQPVFGFFGQGGLSGINDDQLGTLLDLLKQQAANFTLLVGVRDIASPEDDQLAWMMKISNRIKATGVDTTDLPGCMTDVLRGDQVGRTKKIGQPYENKVFESLGHSLAEGHTAGTM